jgi:hypothetical protein
MKLIPFIMLGLITTSIPAHAEDTFFDSLNKKLLEISNGIKGKTPPPSNPPVVVKTPVVTPTVVVDPVKEKFASCKKFLGYIYDVAYVSDPKKVATIYLNAAIDVNNTTPYDTRPSEEEIAERNKCIELALQSGANPDSNGKEKKDDSSFFFETPAPIVRAVRNKNEFAVKLLLDYKANPNAEDLTMGKAIPLLTTAIYSTSQEIALLLIKAGSDLTPPNLLWTAASNAADKVVELLLNKKTPVNQLAKFASFGDDGQTALDASESRLFALTKYQKEIASNSQLSTQEKLSEANNVLYYNYPLMPQLKMKDAVNPDEFINGLLTRQQAISDLLKNAGGVCNEENCGILDFSNNL